MADQILVLDALNALRIETAALVERNNKMMDQLMALREEVRKVVAIAVEKTSSSSTTTTPSADPIETEQKVKPRNYLCEGCGRFTPVGSSDAICSSCSNDTTKMKWTSKRLEEQGDISIKTQSQLYKAYIRFCLEPPFMAELGEKKKRDEHYDQFLKATGREDELDKEPQYDRRWRAWLFANTTECHSPKSFDKVDKE